MIVTEKMAAEAWTLLRTYARMADERWDTDDMIPHMGRSEGDVKSAFHHASKCTHPDMGGTVEKFAAVDRAKHVMLAWLAREKPKHNPGAGTKCHTCEGKGFIMQQRAFRAMRVQCGTCRGTGDLETEHEKGTDR